MPKGKPNKRYTPEFKIMVVENMQKEKLSYNISRHPNLLQVTDMLEKAFSKIPDGTNLILHSDQGWQYQHKHYQQMLKDKGVGTPKNFV